jgi:hypothetical protein
METDLTLKLLCEEAGVFARRESQHADPSLYGVTDGKAVGTYFEHKFQKYLREKYYYAEGSSARGIDFPELNVDMKVTSIKQPQSSCPYRSAKQKIFGLGYSLLVFVYDKFDDSASRSGRLNILHTIFVEAEYTADYQTTSGILYILQNHGNQDDIAAFLMDRYLPVDDLAANQIAQEVIANPPALGYLTISNALQWRLQYRRVIELAGQVDGIKRIW